jgi:hypothetical protein
MNARACIRSYARAAGLSAIWIDGDGVARVGITGSSDDPVIAWAPIAGARKVARWINRQKSTVTVGFSKEAEAAPFLQAAARACRVALISHADVVHRATVTIAAIDARLRAAQCAGALKHINQAFRQQRLHAVTNGRPVLSYAAAMARLRDVLLEAAVQGEPMPPIEDILLRAIPHANTSA